MYNKSRDEERFVEEKKRELRGEGKVGRRRESWELPDGSQINTLLTPRNLLILQLIIPQLIIPQVIIPQLIILLILKFIGVSARTLGAYCCEWHGDEGRHRAGRPPRLGLQPARISCRRKPRF